MWGFEYIADVRRDFELQGEYLIREPSQNGIKASQLASLPDDNYTLFARLKLHV